MLKYCCKLLVVTGVTLYLMNHTEATQEAMGRVSTIISMTILLWFTGIVEWAIFG